MTFKIHNNVLTKEEHKRLVKYITGNGFQWSYNNATYDASDKTDTPQMVRSLMERAHIEDWSDEPSLWTSHHFYHKYFWQIPHLHDILKNCDVEGKYWRIKCNLLQPYPNAPEHHPYHVDVDNNDWQPPGGFTSYIYYINDSDGCTWFENGGKVEPIANTCIEFDSYIKHASSNPTNGPRYIINFVVANTERTLRI